MRPIIIASALAALVPGAAPAAAAQPNDELTVSQRTGSIRPPERSLEQLRREAEAGDGEAQNDLGTRLLDMRDPARQAEARRWFQRASDSGNAEARNNLATMLMFGIGGPADEAGGRRLMEEAAQMGSIGARLSLAERYLQGGDGYPRDHGRAYEQIRAAAGSSGPARLYAQWRLAMMHLQGVGTPRDPQEAYRLLVSASEAGGVEAMISRAVMLATGEGVAEDDGAARRWYQRAAESGERGFEHALRGLGSMLAAGEGGPVDLPRGIAYLRIAQAAGDENAAAILQAFSDRITPEIDEQARRIAGEWMRRHLPTE
ncbi:MAG TPA: tetratricopeptide repeat protein [Allosphingosinicella sp.]|nr:tetratricopeptide repeat protein [Allosphingosinicella sp.]